jgi:oxygen-independent coproporphyrinogen-3 oxidase
MILQLKTGWLTQDIPRKFGVDVWDEFRPVYERFKGDELLDRHNGTIKLTRRGLLEVEEILWEFFEPELQTVRYA